MPVALLRMWSGQVGPRISFYRFAALHLPAPLLTLGMQGVQFCERSFSFERISRVRSYAAAFCPRRFSFLRSAVLLVFPREHQLARSAELLVSICQHNFRATFARSYLDGVMERVFRSCCIFMCFTFLFAGSNSLSGWWIRLNLRKFLKTSEGCCRQAS